MFDTVLVAIIGFGAGVAVAGFVSVRLIHRNELRLARQFAEVEEALRRLDVRIKAIEGRA